MLLNILKNKKFKKKTKNPFEAGFYWGGFLMPILIFMGLRWQDFIYFKVKH